MPNWKSERLAPAGLGVSRNVKKWALTTFRPLGDGATLMATANACSVGRYAPDCTRLETDCDLLCDNEIMPICFSDMHIRNSLAAFRKRFACNANYSFITNNHPGDASTAACSEIFIFL